MFRAELDVALDRSDRAKGGRPPYDAVMRIKVLVLQNNRPERRRRMSAKRKLLWGEDLELVSRELSVPAAELSAWRDAFLAAGEAALKTRPPARTERSLAQILPF